MKPLTAAPSRKQTTTARARSATHPFDLDSSRLTEKTVPVMWVTEWYALPSATALMHPATAVNSSPAA